MEGNSSVLVLYTESDVMFVLGAQKGEGGPLEPLYFSMVDLFVLLFLAQHRQEDFKQRNKSCHVFSLSC